MTTVKTRDRTSKKMAFKLRVRPGADSREPASSAVASEHEAGYQLSSAALCMRRKRKQIKENPLLYSEYKQKVANESRNRRLNRTTAQIEREKEQARIRARRYYTKKKNESGKNVTVAESSANTPTVKPVSKQNLEKATRSTHSKQKPDRKNTRLNTDTKKEYNRRKKIESRARRSDQKRTWDRLKDKRRKQQKKELQKKEKNEKSNATKEKQSYYVSDNAKRIAVSRVFHTIPQSEDKFADVVVGIIDNKQVTLRKRKALSERGVEYIHRREAKCKQIKIKIHL